MSVLKARLSLRFLLHCRLAHFNIRNVSYSCISQWSFPQSCIHARTTTPNWYFVRVCTYYHSEACGNFDFCSCRFKLQSQVMVVDTRYMTRIVPLSLCVLQISRWPPLPDQNDDEGEQCEHCSSRLHDEVYTDHAWNCYSSIALYSLVWSTFCIWLALAFAVARSQEVGMCLTRRLEMPGEFRSVIVQSSMMNCLRQCKITHQR